jgi:hypothetical protein
MNTELIPSLDPTPIPGPEWLFHGLLLLTFFVHLLFLNLTLGGSLLAAVAHWTGGGRADDPRTVLSRRLAGINTYGISLTITTGVAPLLFVQLLFQQTFYTATILIAPIWLGLLLLLIVGYYALYLFKFSGADDTRRRGSTWIALSAMMFLLIASIQVAVNLIHSQPERWQALAQGNWSVLNDATYFPRLLHFLLAAIGFSAGICVWWAARRARAGEAVEVNQRIASYAWRWVVWTIALEILAGFTLLALLPGPVMSRLMRGGAGGLVPLIAAIVLGLGMLMMVTRVRNPVDETKLVNGTLGALTLTVALMTITRHSVRLLYLEPTSSQTEILAAPQWGNFGLFALLLIGGVATLVFMLRRVLTSAATGQEAA